MADENKNTPPQEAPQPPLAPAPPQTIVVQTVTADEEAKAAERAAAYGEALKANETVPGGRYLVDGKLVDANGKPLKG